MALPAAGVGAPERPLPGGRKSRRPLPAGSGARCAWRGAPGKSRRARQLRLPRTARPPRLSPRATIARLLCPPPAGSAAVIDFSLTDENRLVRDSVREFAAAEILPNIREWDEQGVAHPEVFAKMAELGYLGAPIPEAWGGAGMDYVSLAIICEELERADTAFRVVMSVHVGLNSLALLQWGTDEQRRRWLVPQAQGTKLATFALTEPGVGTDAASLQTTARRDGDGLHPQRLEDLDQPGGPCRPFPRLRDGGPGEEASRGDRIHARAGDAGPHDGDAPRKAGDPGRQHGSHQPGQRARTGGEQDRRGRRGLPGGDERHRPGPLHGRRGRGRARAGLPGREPRVLPTSARRSARR